MKQMYSKQRELSFTSYTLLCYMYLLSAKSSVWTFEPERQYSTENHIATQNDDQ